MPGAPVGSVGVGEVDSSETAWRWNPPNPNANLNVFVVGLENGSKSFDAASWNATVKDNASWNTASWGDASWNQASWNAVSWSEVAFSAVSWGESDASWGDVSWNEASWGDASWGESSADNTEGDTSGPPPVMDADAWAAIEAAASSVPEPAPAQP